LFGGADPEAIYNFCLILKTVMKIMSKSLESTSSKVKVKLKVTEKETISIYS